MDPIDRHIVGWGEDELTACTGALDCDCADCAADAAQAEFDAYIARTRL